MKIINESKTWFKIAQKSVKDSDDMYTDYTLYRNKDGSKFICMFGDSDLYEPDEDYADTVFNSEDEAIEWFNNYGDDEDEDY